MAGFVLLPQVSGNGYYSYSKTDQQYGTPNTVETVVQISKDFFRNQRTLIGVGDMSYADGRVFPPHHSHRDGKCVDIRPLAKSKANAPMNIHSPDYDRPATALLIASLQAHRNVLRILFNDHSIHGAMQYPGHENHLHVIMKF